MLKHYISIYYFSGTGNAKRAAEWIELFAKNHHYNTHVINITDIKNIIVAPDSPIIGFCYPTHGFNLAPLMLKFIYNFPRTQKNKRVFLLNTRAGTKLGKVFIPGLSGVALYLPALLLWFKGYKIIGLRPLDLPSNWLSLHPALRKKAVVQIYSRCKNIVEKFTGKILSGKNVYRGLLDLPLDIPVFPIAVLYYFFGRFALAKTFIATSECNLCNVCIDQCPVKAIKLIDNRPFWMYHCESCMHCMNICPQRAIETAHGYTVLLWWLGLSVIPLYFTKILLLHLIPNANFDLIYYLIMALTGLPLVFLGYKILHFLLKYRWFNRLIAITSLTHFKFWGRYKAPKNL
ncbi:MAG: EFR1 family ferrodoxin [Calditrichaceae bacterium]|nr:EFR1 family ferrodoxin [Calditrichaceae bacterium]MBN2709608.1 EFR1 family ferrodoxin [Calditrichaceae bacterium]RQV92405.1 MAG: hypothetical protein EH224_15505 [Calditrichota bacterium]